ncbi:hypothetical protein [Paracoccus benzoatiresistens]|uniref:Uncharacterized protein n=1 Tax=Paracoccus benzoatiresistens TaxID=2997341 RepID=A0ABT4J5Y7_9RHOB|nr:hypothetical protein [Paracoccus sp. EF6]MCZ0962504.1 hypothetical protein [Paracoccus sp. EF6]
MTENRSDARGRAELVFSKLQAPSSARDRAFDEINAIRAAGAEKTQRLREARLAKELQDKEALKGRSAAGLPETS